MKEQLLREIREIAIPELLITYHPHSHVYSRHYKITLSELKTRIRKVPYLEGEIICASRFHTENRMNISTMIETVLERHAEQILRWLKTDPYHAFEICVTFDAPIGDGIVKGTDWNETFPMSNLRIVLKNSDIRGRLFEIITAYPVPGYDEVDQILDAMDEYGSRLRERDV